MSKGEEFKAEEGKFYNQNLQGMVMELNQLPEKSPIAYEVSRFSKKVEKASEVFSELRQDLMSDYLLRDENGEWVPTDEVAEAIEKSKEGDPDAKVSPTEFGYIVASNANTSDKAIDYTKEYISKMNELYQIEIDITPPKSIDVNTKMIRVENEKIPLVECLSDYFGVNSINFLERVGILTGL